MKLYEAGTFVYDVTLSFVCNKITTSDISHVIVKEALLHNAKSLGNEQSEWCARSN